MEKDIAATERITERFRSPAHYEIWGDHAELLYDETESLKNSRALTLESDMSATMDEYYAEVDAINEYVFLVGVSKVPYRWADTRSYVKMVAAVAEVPTLLAQIETPRM